MHNRLVIFFIFIVSTLGYHGDIVNSNNTTPGAIELNATIESIGVVAPYSGDDNQNNTAALAYRESGSQAWLNGHELYVDRANHQWRGSIVALSPDTTYEISVQFSDPDGVSPATQSGAIATRPDYPVVGSGGKIWDVSDAGDLQAVINASSAGDTIRLLDGTYFTSIELLEQNSGTPGHYLTIEAAPGAHAVLDGSDPSINNPNVDNWTKLGNTNIYFTNLSWGGQGCSSEEHLPNYVGEQRSGESVRFLLYYGGYAEWNEFLAAPAGKAFFSCDSSYTIGRLYVTTYEGDDPDKHEINVSQRLNGIELYGADYIRIRNLEFRYYSLYSIQLRKPRGEVDPNIQGSDHNIIEGNTFHSNYYGVFVGQWSNPASASNLIQDNTFYESGYRDSGWTWDQMYHNAFSIGIAVIWAKPGNVVRRNHFDSLSDGIEVNRQAHDTDVYNNLVEESMDDGIEVDNEPSYNIRVWGNTLHYNFSGISVQGWFRGTYTNVGPIYVFRNLIVGGRDPQGRIDSEGNIYNSVYAFKAGADIDGYGAGRVYFYHNTIFIDNSEASGHGIQDAGGAYFAGMVTRNNIWVVSRFVFRLTSPHAIVGHDLDCDNLHNAGTPDDNYFISWSDAIYPNLASFQANVGQELHAISNNNTRFYPDFTLRAGSPEIDAGCIIPGFNDRGKWAYLGSKPDIGAFEYSGVVKELRHLFLPTIRAR